MVQFAKSTLTGRTWRQENPEKNRFCTECSNKTSTDTVYFRENFDRRSTLRSTHQHFGQIDRMSVGRPFPILASCQLVFTSAVVARWPRAHSAGPQIYNLCSCRTIPDWQSCHSVQIRKDHTGFTTILQIAILPHKITRSSCQRWCLLHRSVIAWSNVWQRIWRDLESLELIRHYVFVRWVSQWLHVENRNLYYSHTEEHTEK